MIFFGEYQPRNGTKGSKKKALDEWLKLSEQERDLALITLKNQKKHYAASKAGGLFVAEFPDAFRWLRDKRFNDEITPDDNQESTAVRGPFRSAIEG